MSLQGSPAASLESRILQAISHGETAEDQVFELLAMQIFQFQYQSNPFYRKYCDLSGCSAPGTWQDIPAIPAAAFKRVPIRSFPENETAHCFRTSGTTEQETGVHYFRTLALYEAAILPNFQRFLLPDRRQIRMLVLTPPPAQAPNSSLVHMMQVVMQAFGAPGSDYYLSEAGLDHDRLIADLSEAQRLNQPVFLLGTAFAFVYLLDELAKANKTLQLPEGSRIMETGGFKGRTREIARLELYSMLQQALGIPPTRIVNEYGMTELSSQFYDQTMSSGEPTSLKAVPPWTRVAAVDPASGRILPHGQTGALRIWDLANLGSIIALQTEDAGITHPAGFEVLGRIRSAPIRGCSLSAEDLQQQN